MKISNRKVFITLRILCVFLAIGLIADISLSQLNGSLSRYFESHGLAYVCGGALLVFAVMRINYFFYDDEWEVLHIRSYSLLFSSLQPEANTRYEFPKNKVHHFEYRTTGPFKTLVIFLEGQEEIKRIKNFDLTFLSRNQVKRVLQSLESISRENRRMAKAEA